MTDPLTPWELFRDYHNDLCVILHLDPELATADDVLRLVGECVDRATEVESKSRIAALREALETLATGGDGANPCTVAEYALDADDRAAAEPPLDLPLAEGSEWGEYSCCVAIRDRHGLWVWIDDTRLHSEYWFPDMRNVLALARRKGLV